MFGKILYEVSQSGILDEDELKVTTEEEKVRKVITEAIHKLNLDSTKFYSQLEDKLRQSNDAYNSKTLNQTYQSAIKISVSSPTTIEGFEDHVVEGESRGARPLTNVYAFW